MKLGAAVQTQAWITDQSCLVTNYLQLHLTVRITFILLKQNMFN